MSKIKILIVEDNVTTADGLGFACEMDSMTAIVVYNGTDALAAFKEHEDIDVVILDIGLPDINGFELYRIMNEQRKTPVIFMTSRVSEVDEVCGLEMGADDYVKKPVEVRIMIARIRTVFRRVKGKDVPLPVEETEKVQKSHPDFIIDNESKIIIYKGQPLKLTAEEYKILSHMVLHPNRVFSREQIISIVSDDIYILPSSVNKRMQRLRQKLLKINPGNDILISCRGAGYKLII